MPFAVDRRRIAPLARALAKRIGTDPVIAGGWSAWRRC